MKKSDENLQKAYDKLLSEKELWIQKEALLLKQTTELENIIHFLNDQIKKLLQERYGQKSEKIKNGENPNPNEPSFFDEAILTEEEREIKEEDEFVNVPEHPRKKPGRRRLPDTLPREQIIYDLAPYEKICSCGCELSQIGKQISEQLEFTPAILKVQEHIRLKYACKFCEEGVKIAPVPFQIIPKSIATPGLLAHVLCCKFEDHLPLYRQEKIWQRLGVELPRATLCNWVLKCGHLFAPLIELAKEELINRDYVHADETTVQVLKEPGKNATSKSYMWVYLTGGREKPILIYEYAPGRGGIFPSQFLEDFKGYLQTDAYGGYNVLRARENITVLGCMAHVRRKFIEIVKRTNKTGKAQVAVNYIAKLYAIEKSAREKNLTLDDIFKLRQEKAKPILEKFKVFLNELVPKVPPKSAFGAAISYALSNWVAINIYLENGMLNIDNNPVENKIRPFALGRRNWLFMGNSRGATAAAAIFSLIESAKANGLEGYYYLRHVLTKLPYCQSKEELRALLPHYCDPSEINKL
jgi:transposase